MSGARDAFPLPEDLRVFLTVIRKKSFAAAAEELGLSPAYVSKRIQILEATLSTRLLHRTTRRVALTEDGERTQRWALRILADVDELFDELSVARQTPRGLLRISSSLGFGRSHLAPALARMIELYPELNVRLELFDRVVDIVAEGIDLEILVGDDLPGQCIGRRLADNNRVLCASPAYLQRHGCPQALEDLQSHDCLVIKERDYPFGIWHLERQEQAHSVRVNGPLSSNSGEVVLAWALADRGIMLRSQWEVQPLLASGALVHVLPEYRQSANVWAVYPTRLAHSARLRACVEFLEQYMAAQPVFGHVS